MHKKSKKYPENMENAYNKGQETVDRANDISLDWNIHKKSSYKNKGFNVGFGW